MAKKLVPIGVHYVIPLSGNGILADDSIDVKVHDFGSGPFVEILGLTSEDSDDVLNPNGFCLESAEQIEELSDILKGILKKASI